MRFGWAAVIAVLVVAAIMFSLQDHLLWHPRPYLPVEVDSLPRPLEELAFRTAEGNQTAFYAPPLDRRPFPSELWILFAGNGSLALDWVALTSNDTDQGRAFLLIDYPGYGLCEGHPSPWSIARNVDGAMASLASRLGQPNQAVLKTALAARGPLGVIGHSMGAATALAFAASAPEVSRIVLVSPFTSLRAMARRTVGWPLCWLLRGNFDNLARLDDISRWAKRPRVLILHGDCDTLIPLDMGRMLAAAHPGFTRFECVHGASHDNIVAVSGARLLGAMSEP